jgi:hypothetical protein
MLKTRAEKRNAILRSQIEVACRGAAEFIDAQAAAIKQECENQPLGVIRSTLTRGETCECKVALRLLNGD